ncbi:hypothetical protein AALO_G00126280 [Alosa alosa]|uniref:Uncharacterized protein n=1 Tax=Alosa alosa TaxID=278164 RepID=A0AAV6GL65_9TELE|nr:hypothetical protein AALO_G00126280 [Alosa alosa]
MTHWPKQSKESRKPKKRDKKRTRAFSNYIYKLQKEGSHPNVDVTVFLPKGDVSRVTELVGAEAARLSKFNKRGAITQREVLSALQRLQWGKDVHTART